MTLHAERAVGGDRRGDELPRSFAIYVRQGLALNQLRLSSGDARLDDAQLLDLHREILTA